MSDDLWLESLRIEWDPVWGRVRRNPDGLVRCHGKFGRDCDELPVEGFAFCALHLQIHRAYRRQRHDWNLPRGAVNEVYLRAGGVCEDCGDDECRLEMHHLRYTGHETPDDLALLCRDCHHNRHIDRNGEFWADPEEMARDT